MRFEILEDPTFYPRFLAQDLCDYGTLRAGRDASIWVAGCGTNQALVTALRFPQAQVLGTDASAASLEICAANARLLGVGNLTLEHAGLTQSGHEDRFDHVICTGVIHHNPDPVGCLRRIAAALKPDGVLELMVYNEFHRREPTAFQHALRLLGVEGTPGRSHRLRLARQLASAIPPGSTLGTDLAAFEEPSDEAWADNWMHPCEHAYTVDSLWAMAEECGLQVETSRVNAFDQVTGTYAWDLELPPGDLRDRFEELDDRSRWQVVNLLHLNRSPMLWFYLSPAGRPRRTEAERSAAFLNTRFHRTGTRRQCFVLGDDGRYYPERRTTVFPAGAPPTSARSLFEQVDGERTMREIFAATGQPTHPGTVHRARLELATAGFPFLTAVEEADR